MSQAKYDVVGIGNAIVDVLSHANDGFLEERRLVKGTMALIDEAAAEALYAEMGPGVECSGGSAANTIAGIASLGGNAAFIGKVRDDQIGRVFAHDIRSLGVTFATPPANNGATTARCLILVTPDAQRTMNTFLGACTQLGPEDIEPGIVANADITYLEGYLWDPPMAKEAFRKAMQISHDAGHMVALSLSDPFCVDRWRDEFIALVENEVDILFANENEIVSLYKARDFDEALQRVRHRVQIAALTRSERGSVVIAGEEVHVIDAEKLPKVVDTTGAGDLYAAGFLHGLTQGRDLHDCGRIGSLCAAEVISHFGARPERPLREIVARRFA
jgi:sugar/nucleoside kinase (ribokinase family)